MKLIYFLIIALSALYFQVDGLKILGIIPFPSKSHFSIGYGIMNSLMDVGHEVTLMSPYPQKTKREKFHQIDASKILEIFETDKHEMNPFIFGKFPAVGGLFMLYRLNADVVDLFMQNIEIKKFMKEDHQFDICIFERFLVDSLLGIAEKTNCLIISYTTLAAAQWTDDMTGNDSPASYVPNFFLQYTDKMSFKERLHNTAFSLVAKGIHHGYYLPKHRKLYKKYFPNAKRNFDEMYMNSSIIFTNTHTSSYSIRPNMPSIVEVAGIHVNPPKSLPNDIREFLDSAKDGAILFSMGSFIQSKQWPEDKREAFVKAFGKLKQKILWKYENETLPGNPGNIKIGSWIPQRDIMTHPNVKLFITHGGILGTTEAVIEGIPVLGIPIFADQHMNMERAVSKGYGLKIGFDDVTEQTVFESIREILSNPKYKENADTISKQFNDRPMTPQESVVYWTEYAARHQGASHLKSYSTQLSFIEFYLIDVYCTLIVILIVIMYLNWLILKFVLRKIFKKNPQQKEKRS